MSSKSSKGCWTFDIDGVIADTREAVRAAYEAAGVVQPDDVWGISWKLWLPALTDQPEEVHRLKQAYYQEFLDGGLSVRKLPGCDMAESLLNAGHEVYFVTAASQQSAYAVLEAFGLPPYRLHGFELRAHDRVASLKQLARSTPDALYHTYVDDREEGGNVAADAGWDFTHARWTQ